MKYNVGCDGEETSVTAKDVHSVLDKFEKQEKCVDWIEDDCGVRLLERLQVSDNLSKTLTGAA